MPESRSRWLRFDHLLPGPGAAWLSPAWVEVDSADGTVVAVHEAEPAAIRAAGVEPVEFEGFGLPGMPNLHSHAFQRAMVGFAEHRAADGPDADDSFWTWRRAMYALAGTVDVDQLEAVAAQLWVELLEGGFTSVAEFHYLHHAIEGAYDDPAAASRAIVRAAERVGIGLTLLPVLYRHSGVDPDRRGEAAWQPSAAGQRRFVHDSVDAFVDLFETLYAASPRGSLRRVGVAPHSLRAVSPGELRELVDLVRARDDRAPIHVHVAEQPAEVEQLTAVLGQRPIAWLLETFDCDDSWCFVHATHCDDDERVRMAEHGVVVGLCPTTEANLGDGVFPASAFALGDGGAFGIGTDSHVGVDVAGELCELEYAQRSSLQLRNVLAARTGTSSRHVGRWLVDAALTGGATAVGQEVGAVAVGRHADIVVLDPNGSRLAGHGTETVLDAWVFGGGGAAAVRDVIVGGRQVVRNGRHVLREEIAASFAATMSELRGAMR